MEERLRRRASSVRPRHPSASTTNLLICTDIYKYGYYKAKHRQMYGGSDVGWNVVLPRGPIPNIDPLTDEEEQQLTGGTVQSPNGQMASMSITDASDEGFSPKLERRTTHNDENEKWYVFPIPPTLSCCERGGRGQASDEARDFAPSNAALAIARKRQMLCSGRLLRFDQPH